MDQGEYRKLQSETEEFHKKQKEQISFEAIALNNQLARKNQESFQWETECLKKDNEIRNLQKEIEALKSQLQSLRGQMAEGEITDVIPENCI